MSKTFPSEERYGLTAQLRRSAVSVPSNIAEGRGRQGVGGFLYHSSVAYGSLMEVETQLLIATRLQYMTNETARAILNRAAEVRRLLAAMIRALKRRTPPIADS